MELAFDRIKCKENYTFKIVRNVAIFMVRFAQMTVFVYGKLQYVILIRGSLPLKFLTKPINIAASIANTHTKWNKIRTQGNPLSIHCIIRDTISDEPFVFCSYLGHKMMRNLKPTQVTNNITFGKRPHFNGEKNAERYG